MNRPVRDGQHGQTGYSYGCRCEVCSAAHRALRQDWERRNPGRITVSAEVVELVKAELLRNADLDDEVTLTLNEIASSLGISQRTAASAMSRLIADGWAVDTKQGFNGIRRLRLTVGAA